MKKIKIILITAFVFIFSADLQYSEAAKSKPLEENRNIYDLGDGWEGEFITHPILATSLFRSNENQPEEFRRSGFWEANALILKKGGKPKHCIIHDIGLIPKQIVLDEKLERIAFSTRIDKASFSIRMVSLKTQVCCLADLNPIQQVISKHTSNWTQSELLSPVHLFFLRKEGTKAVGYAVYNTIHIKFSIDLAQKWPEEGKDCKLEIEGVKISDKKVDMHNFKEEI